MDPRLLRALCWRAAARGGRQISRPPWRFMEQRSEPPHDHLPPCLQSGFSFRCEWRIPMRSLGELTAAALFLVAGDSALADPSPAPGYAVTVAKKAGAIFGELARDGDAIVVTDLASGRLLRYAASSGFVPFGPLFPHGLDAFGDPTGPYKAVP